MIKLALKVLKEKAKTRPDGYLNEVCAAGKVEAGYVWLTKESYAKLRARFSSASVCPAVSLAQARFAACKTCDKALNSAFDCALHKGCCFGRWRADPANKCQEGKW